MFKLIYGTLAQRDAKKIKRSNLKQKVEQMLLKLEKDPHYFPPHFEKLSGQGEGSYSRRINHQHRLVYQVYEKEKIVKVIRMWTHYR